MEAKVQSEMDIEDMLDDLGNVLEAADILIKRDN